MLSIKLIREDRERIERLLEIRNFDSKKYIEQILTQDDIRKAIQLEKNQAQEKLNALSKNIGKYYSQGLNEEANKLKNETLELKEKIKVLETNYSEIENQIQDILINIPNIPHHSVPKGKGEKDNIIVKQGGEIPDLSQNKPHWELIKDYNIIDFELGNKITGAGFPFYINKGAKLLRALINFFLDEGEKAGYSEVITPVIVNRDSAFATGQLPDKDGQMYHIEQDNFYLIPTAEVTITNIYRNVILKENELPIKNIAYSSCFRREAGSWGADVRGLNRLHQFDKVEIVQVQKPENSYNALKEMTDYVESLIKKLNLKYRILKLCGGDLGFTSALTYDFEVFSAAQKKWLEVSSVSNFEDFQTNRLKLRYKSEKLKTNITAHSLNGSALALPRIMAAIIENNQTIDGIIIPEILRKYTNFDIIRKD